MESGESNGSSPTGGTGLMNSRGWRFPAAAFSLKPIWRMCRYVGAQYLAIRQIVGYLHVPATPVKTDAYPMLFCLLMFD